MIAAWTEEEAMAEAEQGDRRARRQAGGHFILAGYGLPGLRRSAEALDVRASAVLCA